MPDADEVAELELVRAIQRDGVSNSRAWTQLLSNYQHRLYAVCLRMVGDREAAADLTQDTFVKIIQGLSSYDGRSKLSTWMIRIAMNTCLSYLRGQRHRRHASLESVMESGAAPGPGLPNRASEKRSVPGRPDHTGQRETETRSTGVADRTKIDQAAADPVGSGFSGPGGADKPSDWREQTRELLPAESVKLQERRRLVAAAFSALPADQRAVLVLRDIQDLDYEQIAQAMDLAVGTVKSRLFRARLALREAVEAAESRPRSTTDEPDRPRAPRSADRDPSADVYDR